MILPCRPKLLHAIALCTVVQAVSYGPPRNGPKRIEADGVICIACDGVLWLQNDKIQIDNEPPTYHVLYKDADGNEHELKMVRMLKITELPSDTPACLSHPQK
jgi:hypothetical protein